MKRCELNISKCSKKENIFTEYKNIYRSFVSEKKNLNYIKNGPKLFVHKHVDFFRILNCAWEYTVQYVGLKYHNEKCDVPSFS